MRRNKLVQINIPEHFENPYERVNFRAWRNGVGSSLISSMPKRHSKLWVYCPNVDRYLFGRGNTTIGIEEIEVALREIQKGKQEARENLRTTFYDSDIYGDNFPNKETISLEGVKFLKYLSNLEKIFRNAKGKTNIQVIPIR